MSIRSEEDVFSIASLFVAHVPRRASDIDRLIGRRIRQLRKQQRLTLASVADILGISHPQMQKYETGANRLSLGTFIRLSVALGIAPSSFINDICREINDSAAEVRSPS